MSGPVALEPALRAWLTRQVGEVGAAHELVGGITAQMLLIERPGREDVVVRRWVGVREDEEGLVDREVAGLAALAGSGVPVPEVLAADPAGSLSGRPTSVTSACRGRVDLDPTDLREWVRRLAHMLVRIHEVPDPGLEPCAPWSPADPTWIADAGDVGLLRDVEQLIARPSDPADRVVSHGDYQHFNVLWEGAEIAAVVDWPSAGLADRGLDVGHCRLNLAVLFSADAAMWFLEDVEQCAGRPVDAARDLERLVHFGPDWPEFIPLQVAGRRRVDGPGMEHRVRETIARTLRRAG